MRYEYWQNKPMQVTYAVKLDDDGKVLGSYGPIHPSVFKNANLAHFRYDCDDGRWIGTLAHMYRKVEPLR